MSYPLFANTFPLLLVNTQKGAFADCHCVAQPIEGPFNVEVEQVPDPKIQHPNDVIIRITSTCICGSDLHMYEGRTAAKPGIVFGHENMGIVEEIGSSVAQRNANVLPAMLAGEMHHIVCPFIARQIEDRIILEGSLMTAKDRTTGQSQQY